MLDVLNTSRFFPLVGLFFSLLLLREYFSFRTVLPAKYILTPLVTFSIIGIALLPVGSLGLGTYRLLVLLGLTISLAADTLLMIEERSYFLQGLIFFLLTHVFYIGAFSLGYAFRAWHLGVAAALLAPTSVIFLRILRARTARNLWVFMYILTLSVMCYFAWSHLGRAPSPKAALLPVGATLFVVSDAVLGINTFVRRIPHSTVLTWSLYAPAQFCIAVSCFF